MGLFDFLRKKPKKEVSKSHCEIPEEIPSPEEILIDSDQKKEKELTLDSLDAKSIEYFVNHFAEKLANEVLSTNPYYRDDSQSTLIDLSDRDPLFDEAARLIVIHQQGSTSLIQRKFSIGYNRAGRLLDQLEASGIVGPTQGSKAREVFIADEYHLEIILNSLDDGNYIPKTYQKINSKLKEEIRLKYSDSIERRKDEIIAEAMLEEERYKEAVLEAKKEEIRRELIEKEQNRQLKRQVRKELIESGHIQQNKKRKPIPQDVQDKVWVRDGGKCVFCGSVESLEFDHIIPFSKGGANTYRNIQLLCEKCNRQKSNKIG